MSGPSALWLIRSFVTGAVITIWAAYDILACGRRRLAPATVTGVPDGRPR